METAFDPLPTHALPKHTDLVQIEERPRPALTLKSPALSVMTDLRVHDPIAIDEDADLASAHLLMISRAIRLLFVRDGQGRFTGLITATDLSSERPIQCVKEHGKRHADITVRDVMTPCKALDALKLEDMQRASVGELLATMKQLGRQHALVIEDGQHGHSQLCGLISTSHMARLLGMPLSFRRVPRALSELQHSLLYAG